MGRSRTDKMDPDQVRDDKEFIVYANVLALGVRCDVKWQKWKSCNLTLCEKPMSENGSDLSDDEINEIAARCESATLGPWFSGSPSVRDDELEAIESDP